MATLESVKKSILAECEEDHVGLWSVVREVEEHFPRHDEAAIRDRVLSVLRELLLEKKIKAGFPTEAGKFRSLRIGPEKVLHRIESEWPVGRRPSIGDGLWFTRAAKTEMYRSLQRETSLASAHRKHKKRPQTKGR
jgi:hypothetical protein